MSEKGKREWHIEMYVGTFFIVDSENKSIAELYRFGSEDERKDCANLMAAAPKMVEALDRALTILCTAYENGKAGISIDHAGDVISDIKNALDKATGKAVDDE